MDIKKPTRTSLVIQCLRLHPPNAGFNPWSRNETPHATNQIYCSQINKHIEKKKKKEKPTMQDFPSGPEVRVPNAGAWVQFLVRELDAHVTAKTW